MSLSVLGFLVEVSHVANDLIKNNEAALCKSQIFHNFGLIVGTVFGEVENVHEYCCEVIAPDVRQKS